MEGDLDVNHGEHKWMMDHCQVCGCYLGEVCEFCGIPDPNGTGGHKKAAEGWCVVCSQEDLLAQRERCYAERDRLAARVKELEEALAMAESYLRGLRRHPDSPAFRAHAKLRAALAGKEAS